MNSVLQDTSQWLQQGIKQLVPKSILQCHSLHFHSYFSCCKSNSSQIFSFLAMGKHVLQNQSCAHKYTEDKFSILASKRTAFHLSTLEATYIKTYKPGSCKQNEFISSLKLPHWLLVFIGHFFDQSLVSALPFLFLYFCYKSSCTSFSFLFDVFP